MDSKVRSLIERKREKKNLKRVKKKKRKQHDVAMVEGGGGYEKMVGVEIL